MILVIGSVLRRRDDAPAGRRQTVLGGDDAPAGANTDAKPKVRVQRWQEAKPMHEAGVVSRVPRDSRHAQAWEMDRNTDQTSSTHQHGAGRQDERNDDGEDDRRYEERTLRRTKDQPQNLSWELDRLSAGDGRDGSAFLTRKSSD